MKHSKEWHTCDRCGAKIKIKPTAKMSFQMCGAYGDMMFEVITKENFEKLNDK